MVCRAIIIALLTKMDPTLNAIIGQSSESMYGVLRYLQSLRLVRQFQ